MRAALGDALDATRTHEVRTAARALLRTPLVRPAGARRQMEAFTLVRRHERELREWFDRHTGWRLVVTPEAARLMLAPPDPDDATHPLTEAAGARRPFTRRRYVLLCLCLAALERADTQVALGRLAEQVVLLVADPQLLDAGIGFSLERRDERLDLVAVVRVLLEWGVLTRVAGAEDSFVAAEGDVLYDVDRRVLALMLVGPTTAPRAEAPEAPDASEAPPDGGPGDGGPGDGGPGDPMAALSEETRTRALRHRLTRLLLCLPVVHLADLTDAESAYLTSQRGALTRRITELTGLEPEVRAEGIAMVDPDDDLTDVSMPESGTDGHLALLVAEHLAGRDRAAPGVVVGLPDLHRLVRRLAREHAADWRKDTQAPGAETELLDAALDRLAALRLLRRVSAGDAGGAGGVTALPALHRYAVGAPRRSPSPAAAGSGSPGTSSRTRSTR